MSGCEGLRYAAGRADLVPLAELGDRRLAGFALDVVNLEADDRALLLRAALDGVPLLAEVADLAVDDLAEDGFDVVDLALDFLAVVDLAGLALDLEEARLVVALARLFERLERERRTARFQPSARSARNDAGMARICSVSSTDSAAASARSARTSAITLAGRRARAACTRLVRRTTNISRSGSIHIDVPVKPVWP